jgi:tetratricopeptide (TPR) repeat protein
MIHPNASQIALSALLPVLLWTAGCAAEGHAVKRPEPGQEVNLARAERATQAGDWHKAAVLWNELFLRGGGERVRACRETARALIELGDHDGARAVLELGLRLDPGEPALLETQGDVLVAMGFRRAAEAAYVEALDADPERQHALLELARVRIDLGREHLAIEALEQRLALGADDAETHLLHARALVACDQPEEAYQAFIQAIEKGADDPLCLVSAASVSFDERLPDRSACRAQARAWLERASETDPQLTLALYYLGVLCEEERDLEGALLHYERAVETDPGDPRSLTRLAGVLDELGQGERAALIADRALEFERDPESRARLKRIAGS